MVDEMAKQPGLSFHDMQQQLSKLGVRMDHHGSYSWNSGRNQLHLEDIHRLKYAERLQLANSVRINDTNGKSVLGKLFKVNPGELASAVLSNQRFEAHRAALTYLDQTNRWEEGLKHFKYQLLRDDKGIYLFVPSDPALLEVEKLLGRSPSISMDHVPHIDTITDEIKLDELHSSRENILEALVGLMAESQQPPKEDKDHKRKTIKL